MAAALNVENIVAEEEDLRVGEPGEILSNVIMLERVLELQSISGYVLR